MRKSTESSSRTETLTLSSYQEEREEEEDHRSSSSSSSVGREGMGRIALTQDEENLHAAVPDIDLYMPFCMYIHTSPP